MKKFLAVLLAFVLMLTSPAYSGIGCAKDGLKDSYGAAVGDDGAMTMKGTNSFGTLLADSLAAKIDEQENNEGCNIFSIEVKGSEAEVSFETIQDATLVVGIYEDDGVKMLGSGQTDVSSEDTEAVVFIEIDTMPQTFYLRGFLIEGTSLHPLCNAYESPNYTQEMQEFFAKTTDDFPVNRVLDLDGDKTNNFAVYGDDVKVVSGAGIELKSIDEINNIYVFENAGHIAALKRGDTFAYSYKDDNVLIVKVKDIQTEGNTVTVTGMDTSIEDVFEYVKIDTESDMSDVTVDPSGCDEGVIYKGTVQDSERIARENVFEGEGSVNKSLLYEFLKDEDKVESDNGDKIKGISGDVKLGVTANIKVYISRKHQYLELTLDYTVNLNITISVKNDFKACLGYLGIAPVPGVYIVLTPYFIANASASLSMDGTLTGTFGFAAEDEKEIRNLSQKPHLETELKGEFTISVGLSLDSKVDIICESFANASMNVSAAAQVKGEFCYNSKKESDPSVIHECELCVDGDISDVIDLKFKLQLLKSDKFKRTYAKNYTIKLCDWYYSADFQEFAFSVCPHYLFKTAITARYFLERISGAEVELPFILIEKDANGKEQQKEVTSLLTDENGTVAGYLPSGKYTVTVTAENYKKKTKEIRIKDDAKSVGIWLSKDLNGDENEGNDSEGGGNNTTAMNVQTFSLDTELSGLITEDGGLYVWGRMPVGDGYVIPTKVLDHVISVNVNSNVIGAITEDGSLYMWGYNLYGEVGNGTKEPVPTPIKILDHVKSINIGSNRHVGAITEDGSLYIWGNNRSGESGTGTTGDVLTPTKVLDHVKSVSLGNGTVGAITEDGSLYMWGSNAFGEIGIGTTENVLTPTKVLDHVKSVCVGSARSGAITEDGSLYMWGYNYGGAIGTGPVEGGEWNSILVPTKVLEHVKSVHMGYESYNGAITEEGDLYMWGDNRRGQIGNGADRAFVLTPTKILEHVKLIEFGLWHSGAVTEDGNLYMWGYNSSGQIGNGTKESVLIPFKVLEHVKLFSAGFSHSGAVTEDGSLFMWGSNDEGEIGNGRKGDIVNEIKEDVLIPTKILDNVKLNNIQSNTVQIKDVPVYQEIQLSIKKLRDIIPSVSQTEGRSKTASFTDLTPNAVYNFYVLKSKTSGDDLLHPSNLLYLTQATAGADGSMKVYYQTDKDSVGADVFVVNMEQMQISSATVNVQDLEYNQKSQYIHPVVTYQEKMLEEWEDYELLGDYSATDVGDYTVTVQGIGDYKGSVNASYKITEAKSRKVERITLSVLDASLNTGNTLQLNAEIFPQNAENKNLQWSSSNTHVATVDSNGLVTAVSAGTATITVKSQDGSGVNASCVITVTKISDNPSGGNSSGGSNDGTTGGSNGGASGSNSSGGSANENPSNGSAGNTLGGNMQDNQSENNPDNGDDGGLQVTLLYYIIEFNANGGTGLSRKTMTLLMDDTLGILPKIQRKKYDFKGWYTQKSGGEKVTQVDMLNVSTTLYAQWEKTAKPVKPTKVSLTQKKGGKVKVGYKKVSGALGYQIAYSTSKKFSSSTTKKVTTVSTSKMLKNLKKGSTYYFRVRAYKTDSAGNKIYGTYSGTKKVKVKI